MENISFIRERVVPLTHYYVVLVIIVFNIKQETLYQLGSLMITLDVLD